MNNQLDVVLGPAIASAEKKCASSTMPRRFALDITADGLHAPHVRRVQKPLHFTDIDECAEQLGVDRAAFGDGHEFAFVIDQRPPRIARIRRRIGFDYLRLEIDDVIVDLGPPPLVIDLPNSARRVDPKRVALPRISQRVDGLPGLSRRRSETESLSPVGDAFDLDEGNIRPFVPGDDAAANAQFRRRRV